MIDEGNEDIVSLTWDREPQEIYLTQRSNGNHCVTSIQRSFRGDKLITKVDSGIENEWFYQKGRLDSIHSIEVIDGDGNTHTFKDAKSVRYQVETDY